MSSQSQSWKNGTVTTVDSLAETVRVHDMSDRLKDGSAQREYSPEGAFNLADEHERFAIILRSAAREVLLRT